MQILIAVAMLLCAPADHFEVESTQNYRVADLPISLTITAVDAAGEVTPNYCGAADLAGVYQSTAAQGEVEPVATTEVFSEGKVTVENVLVAEGGMTVSSGPASGKWKPDVRRLPGWFSILPPLVAILLALVTRQALIALFSGVYIGTLLIYSFNPLTALLRVFDTHLVAAAADPFHASILLFTMALGGMVGILAKSGGTNALVEVLSRRARSKRSGMVMGWLTGLVVFFDDYANCLLVGNTLRPFTDKLSISREKLAYIVDSTAAPITSVALISTWVGYQLGLIEDLAGPNSSAYDLFLNMLPYSFYSFFTMFFVLAIAVTCRDFGPMLTAEKRAAAGQVLRDGASPMMDKELTEMQPPEGRTPHWSLAIIPIVSVILIVAIGLYTSGVQAVGASAGLREIIANANSYAVLLWAAFGGSMVAAVYAVAKRNLNISETVDAWVTGCKAMVIAVLILVLAWTIGEICKDYLQTGPWVISQFSPSPQWIPAMTFVLCAVIALATGSSFSTMAIVIPIAGPMAWAATGDTSGLDPVVGESIRLATLSSVLGGAVFGDHCSPISDTTIMSSMSCASDHIDHVRTQAPYALVCGGAAILIGYIPAGFGVSPLITLPLGMLALGALVRFYGKPSTEG
ncbi:MAG: Na+/H+ antiporter NhaC family protein [Myxococcales bacterium]|nr:Na+/H+ antiporter NhaC family protein [Myxococcales bacterium]